MENGERNRKMERKREWKMEGEGKGEWKIEWEMEKGKEMERERGERKGKGVSVAERPRALSGGVWGHSSVALVILALFGVRITEFPLFRPCFTQPLQLSLCLCRGAGFGSGHKHSPCFSPGQGHCSGIVPKQFPGSCTPNPG